MKAHETAALIAKSPLTLAEKISWHLTLFEKPLPQSMVAVCVQAIYLARLGCDLETVLELPEGATYFGNPWASAQSVIDGHQLRFFLAAPAEVEATD